MTKHDAPHYKLEDRGQSTPCWTWLRAKDSNGYGRMQHSAMSKNIGLAHRVVYERIFGPIPSGLVLDHLCRNPDCVNPNHMEPVPIRTNLLRGKGTKLTDEQIAEIKRLYKRGNAPQLAERFGVSRQYVWQLAKSKRTDLR